MLYNCYIYCTTIPSELENYVIINSAQFCVQQTNVLKWWESSVLSDSRSLKGFAQNTDSANHVLVLLRKASAKKGSGLGADTISANFGEKESVLTSF